MPKINHEEYEVLKELDDKWKWIARDKDGTLVMGAGKNERYLDGWFPPENIGDSLVADEINAVKVISEWGNLFQFIQWEDDEPYNIQELIEEYLYDNQPKLFIDGQEQSFEFIEESEEKEVKKLKSVITEFSQESQVVNSWEGSFTGGYLSSIGFAEVEISSESPLDRGEYLGKEVTIIVGDDEPEVLSQEWIDEHKETIFDLDEDFETEFIKADDLQNLLVPKQELPVIPQFVADWIEESHSLGNNLNHDIFNLITDAYDTDADERKLIENYLYDSSDAIETIVDAYRYGYEVAEEQKYYVIDKDDNILLLRGYKGIEKADNLKISNSGGGALKLTEQEIKDYDERYWAFAVKVEELKEC